jgi:hypothetical protein
LTAVHAPASISRLASSGSVAPMLQPGWRPSTTTSSSDLLDEDRGGRRRGDGQQQEADLRQHHGASVPPALDAVPRPD